jgi:TonB family protein
MLSPRTTHHLRVARVAVVIAALSPAFAGAAPQYLEEARLRAAIEADPQAPGPHLALARHYLAAGIRPLDVDRELELTIERIAQRRSGAAAPASADERTPLPRAGRDVPMPRALKRVPPVYPLDAAKAGVMGHVILDVVIDKQGQTRKVRIVKSISDLDRAARDAVEQWRFEPVLVNGVATDVAATLVLKFGFRRDATPGDDLELAAFDLGRGDDVEADRAIRRALASMREEAEAFNRVATGLSLLAKGKVTPPQKIKDVKPVYPPLAQEARAKGVVGVEAVLDEAGKITRARVTTSIPMLDQAALDAVKRWEFSPATVDGAPVPIRVLVMVNFTLE